MEHSELGVITQKVSLVLAIQQIEVHERRSAPKQTGRVLLPVLLMWPLLKQMVHSGCGEGTAQDSSVLAIHQIEVHQHKLVRRQIGCQLVLVAHSHLLEKRMVHSGVGALTAIISSDSAREIIVMNYLPYK